MQLFKYTVRLVIVQSSHSTMNIEKGSFWTDQAANYQVVDVVGSDVFLKDGGGSVSKLKKNLTSKIFGVCVNTGSGGRRSGGRSGGEKDSSYDTAPFYL